MGFGGRNPDRTGKPAGANNSAHASISILPGPPLCKDEVLEEILTAKSKKSHKFLFSIPFLTFFFSTSFTFSTLW
jgi:hypothetical protein